MKILGFEITRGTAEKTEIADQKKPQATANISEYGSSSIQHLGTHVLRGWDGEKNSGELGPVISYVPDYYRLTERSWQAYAENDVAKTILDKWTTWIIDIGLKLRANPAKIVLESEGISMSKDQSESFNDVVESRFEIWSNSKNSTHTGEQTFNELTRTAYINSKMGDCLVVLRYVNNTVKVQLIDGMKVQNPLGLNKSEAGNIISNGVEITPTGSHVGYHIRKNFRETEFIPAYSESTGLRTAFLVYGSTWRLDYHRGLPKIATSLESLKKLERYKEATVAGAEEIAKVAYQIVHQNYSDGENPFLANLATANGLDPSAVPVDYAGEVMAKKVAATTDKMTINNTKGSEIKPLNQGNGVAGFGEFHKSNADLICASVGIPPNVAFSLYNDSFSASRAATKDWDHTMIVERNWFAKMFYDYVYKFWFFTEVAKGKISAPGFLSAFSIGDFMITESYQRARFTGPMFPHIDPLKEANAERTKLGTAMAHVPLTDVETAVETLGSGESDSVLEQAADELKRATDLGILPPAKDSAVVEPVKGV